MTMERSDYQLECLYAQLQPVNALGFQRLRKYLGLSPAQFEHCTRVLFQVKTELTLDQFKHVVRVLDRLDFLNQEELLFSLLDFGEEGAVEQSGVRVLLGERFSLQKEFVETNLKFYGTEGRYRFADYLLMKQQCDTENEMQMS